MTTQLLKGQNIPLNATELLVSVQSSAPVDVSALLVTPAGKVRSDDDFVFYNQPHAPGVELSAGALRISPARVPAGIDQIRAIITLEDSRGSFGQFAAPVATVTDQSGNVLCQYRIEQLGPESVVIALEVYRRNAQWKIRAVGQGYAGGFADLVTDHGITVDDVPTAAPVAPAADPSGVRTVAGEATLSLEKRQKLDLRKREVAKVLLTKGASGVRARVILVIDKTGSMHSLYRDKVVHRVVERMIPVAIQLDDDGNLETYLYGDKFAKLPDVTVADADSWSATFLHISGRHGGIDYNRQIGGVNDEIPVMTDILQSLRPGADPALVLFFTDGGFHKRAKITALMRQAAALPAFWQFIGLGDNDFGILRKLDTMDGRVVDNAGFFAVPDIDSMSDADLYGLLLGEFPDWLSEARRAGVLR
ncbi:VWA domain-containing protein [Nocardia sp. NPDC057668]|uniref:vWA domain-containing protein n=1 Tax=Nocardia sp. NPDC057668 TaxID=3346202 RepID=UPI003672EF73